MRRLPRAFHPLSAADRKKLQGQLVVASVSGGKDSAAMSLWLTENDIEHRRLFADTGWEANVTYEYLRGPLAAKLGPIEEVRGKETFEERAIRSGMFPSRLRRWCTRELKTDPLFARLNALAEDHDVVNAVGIRWAESEKRRSFRAWDATEGLDAKVWRPILAWSEDDVIAIHQRHDLAPNPLYLRGARRVGCWPCVFSSKDELRLVADTDPARIDRIRAMEAAVGATATSRDLQSSLEHGPPAMFQARLEQPDGTYPCWPIDQVVAWSRTERGGKQFGLFAPPADQGCARWGMCEPQAEAAEARS